MSNSPSLRLSPRWPYLSLALMALQRALAYRMTFFFNQLTGLIWVAIAYYLWQTVFRTHDQIGNFDWTMMRTYLLLSYAVNALLSWNTLGRMLGSIRTGQIAIELFRPLDYLLAQLAQATGAALIEGGLSSVITVLLGILILHVSPPISLAAGIYFGLSVLLGFLIKFLSGFLLSLLCFWTINSVGLMWTYYALVGLLSGALVPLTLLPGWAHTVVFLLPFQAMLATPLAIYLGTVQGLAVGQALGVQILWIMMLWLLVSWLWTPALRALEVQGG